MNSLAHLGLLLSAAALVALAVAGQPEQRRFRLCVTSAIVTLIATAGIWLIWSSLVYGIHSIAEVACAVGAATVSVVTALILVRRVRGLE